MSNVIHELQFDLLFVCLLSHLYVFIGSMVKRLLARQRFSIIRWSTETYKTRLHENCNIVAPLRTCVLSLQSNSDNGALLSSVGAVTQPWVVPKRVIHMLICHVTITFLITQACGLHAHTSSCGTRRGRQLICHSFLFVMDVSVWGNRYVVAFNGREVKVINTESRKCTA